MSSIFESWQIKPLIDQCLRIVKIKHQGTKYISASSRMKLPLYDAGLSTSPAILGISVGELCEFIFGNKV